MNSWFFCSNKENMSWQVCSPVDLGGLLVQMKALRNAVKDTQRRRC